MHLSVGFVRGGNRGIFLSLFHTLNKATFIPTFSHIPFFSLLFFLFLSFLLLYFIKPFSSFHTFSDSWNFTCTFCAHFKSQQLEALKSVTSFLNSPIHQFHSIHSSFIHFRSLFPLFASNSRTHSTFHPTFSIYHMIPIPSDTTVCSFQISIVLLCACARVFICLCFSSKVFKLQWMQA